MADQVVARLSTRQYREDIDGLRCLAVLAVVAFHAGIPFLSGGFIGVDVFFVISGYLIGAHVYQETRSGKFLLSRFYERRARRILPALFFVLLACYGISCLILSPKELQGFAAEALAALTSTANIFMYRRGAAYFAASSNASPLRMTWSLGVEEQFYIGLPLLLMFVKRWRSRTVLAVLSGLITASFCLSIYTVFENQSAAFYLIPSRAWELGAGCLLGILEVEEGADDSKRRWGTHSLILGVLGLSLLVACVLRFNEIMNFPGLAAVPPVAAALILIRTRDTFFNKVLLGSRPLRSLGLVSYSWYLWHWPLLSFAHIVSGGPLKVSTACLLLILALLLSVATYFLVEQPFRRIPLGGPSMLVRYGIASAVLCIPVWILHKTHGWPSRYPAAAATEAQALQAFPDSCLAPYGRSSVDTSTACHPMERFRPTLALLGDSHASALAGALHLEAQQNQWQIWDETKSSCPPLYGVTRWMDHRPEHARECAAFNNDALGRVIADGNVQRVVLGGFWGAPFQASNEGPYVRTDQESLPSSKSDSAQNLRRGIDGILARLHDAGKEVYVVLDVPLFLEDPMQAQLGKKIAPRAAVRRILGNSLDADLREPRSAVLSRDTEDAARIVRESALAHGAHVIDPTVPLCSADQCRASLDGQSLYIDQQHLSLLGSTLALRHAGIFRTASDPGSARRLVSER